MSDQIRVLDELDEQFVRMVAASAKRRRPGLRPFGLWRARRPRRGLPRPRILVVVLVLCIGSASVALATAGVFQTGTPLEPAAPAVATQGDGTAVAQTSAVLLQASDPSGGLPWGVRVVDTTRGDACVQVGRVQSATIGVLGQDGAFANDSQFHPLSANYNESLSCADTDANGAAFLNVVRDNMPASAFDGGCRLGDQPPPRLPAAAHQSSALPAPVCSPTDLRDVYYGLLGPDAVSVTYATASGQTVTTPTAGPDGAYLIVLPHVAGGAPCSADHPLCPTDTMGIGDGIWADGVIRSVQYSDGQTCSRNPSLPLGQQPPCPQVGAPPPAATRPAITVAAPIMVRVDSSSTVTVSFTSRVAITNSSSYYYFTFNNPTPAESGSTSSACNPNISSDFLTDSDYQPGQTVSDTQSLPPCTGVFHGTVVLVTNGDARDHLPGVIGQNAVLVGDFSVEMP